jgi:hypothetical protein
MNSSSKNSPVSIILFNDKSNKTFSHTRAFKRLLGAAKIKVFPKNGQIYKTADLLLNSLAAKSISTPASLNDRTPEFKCTHLIRISENIKRNVFFDAAYSEHIIGSFTAALEDLEQLNQLNSQFFEALYIHRTPLKWLHNAETNKSTYAMLEINDPTVSEFNLHYLRCISETYGLQALTDCQSKIIKWIEDHRWRYID